MRTISWSAWSPGVSPVRVSATLLVRDPGEKGFFVFEGCADIVFPAVTLPAEVDPLKTSARLRDGILELVIPKALSTERSANELQPNSIVRSKDYKRWTYAYVQLLEGRR